MDADKITLKNKKIWFPELEFGGAETFSRYDEITMKANPLAKRRKLVPQTEEELFEVLNEDFGAATPQDLQGMLQLEMSLGMLPALEEVGSNPMLDMSRNDASLSAAGGGLLEMTTPGSGRRSAKRRKLGRVFSLWAAMRLLLFDEMGGFSRNFRRNGSCASSLYFSQN